MKYHFTLSLLITIQSATAQFTYVNPKPGSLLHQPATGIILKVATGIDKSSLEENNFIKITGSSSGLHKWTARISDDNKTVVIHPLEEFEYGEYITVIVNSDLRKLTGEIVAGTTFSFGIKNKTAPEEELLYKEAERRSLMEDDEYSGGGNEKIQYPLDSMPTYTINVNNSPSPGQIFYCNHEDDDGLGTPKTNSFTTIIQNNGKIVWARDMGQNGRDFKINYDGYLTYYSYDRKQWMIMDSNYNLIDSVVCRNGYENETNDHDVSMYPDGHVFLLAYDNQTIDMSAYGGLSNAIVQGLIVQELDAERDVVFEWRSWDHFQYTDANIYTSLTNLYVDYVHGNSVERDYDGNIIISCRNMDEVTKIDHSTGNIIWRMGGENNEFTFINDNIPEHFASQHDVHRISNGHLTVFNNGNHLNPLISSAKEYAVDEGAKVATLVWYYEHPDVNGVHMYGSATGNFQRLANGNAMIDWGLIASGLGLPNQTEVDSNKNIVWEMTFDSAGQKSYRVHKYKWNPCSRITGYTMKSQPGPGKVKLEWGIATGAKSYHVQYRPLGTNGWTSIKTSKTRFQLTGLNPSIAYEWRVKTICSTDPQIASTFSVRDTFVTLSLKPQQDASSEDDLISVYPIPASNQITISTEEPSVLYIRIMDILGNIIYENDFSANQELVIDTTQWPSGLYLVECSNGGKREIDKILRE